MSLASFSKYERLLDRVVPVALLALGLWISAAVVSVSL
jgi:hypothetical protein